MNMFVSSHQTRPRCSCQGGTLEYTSEAKLSPAAIPKMEHYFLNILWHYLCFVRVLAQKIFGAVANEAPRPPHFNLVLAREVGLDLSEPGSSL